MVRRPGDKTPDPPGGRAADRLQMFEQARGLKDIAQGPKKEKKVTGNVKKDAPSNKGMTSDEEPDRRRK